MAEQQPAGQAQQPQKDQAAPQPHQSAANDKNAIVQGKKSGSRHSFMVSGTKFIVDSCYAPIKPVGTGAYGVVW